MKNICWMRRVQIFKMFERRERVEISILPKIVTFFSTLSDRIISIGKTYSRLSLFFSTLRSLDSTEISTFSRRLNLFKICTLRIQHILYAAMRFLENLECNFYEKSKIQNSRKMETGFWEYMSKTQFPFFSNFEFWISYRDRNPNFLKTA